MGYSAVKDFRRFYFNPKSCFCYKMCMDVNTEKCNNQCKYYENTSMINYPRKPPPPLPPPRIIK